VIGLVYGFLWEAFISLIPGPIDQWTVVYYLRGIGSKLVPSGSLGSGPSSLSVPGATLGLVLFALGSLAAATIVLRYSETRAAAAPT
jgi:hypothetical protein